MCSIRSVDKHGPAVRAEALSRAYRFAAAFALLQPAIETEALPVGHTGLLELGLIQPCFACTERKSIINGCTILGGARQNT